MDKPKNLYVGPMDMNCVGAMIMGGGYKMKGNKWEKKMGTVIA